MAATSISPFYEESQTGIPQGYTEALEALGYIAKPFAPQEEIFKNQIGFQHALKGMLDSQLGAFQPHGVGMNTAMLPFNMRKLFAGGASVLTDPMYGIIGAPGFFGGGYKMGALPSNRSWAYDAWKNASEGYANTPPPLPTSNNGGGGGGGNNVATGSYTVALPGGGSVTVNASDPDAARENAGVGSDARVEAGSYLF